MIEISGYYVSLGETHIQTTKIEERVKKKNCATCQGHIFFYA